MTSPGDWNLATQPARLANWGGAVVPLPVGVRGRHPRPSHRRRSRHRSWARRLDVGSNFIIWSCQLLSARRAVALTRPGSERCSVPREPVRTCEGPGIAANHEPVRSGAVGTGAGVLGEGTAPVERELLRDSTEWRTSADLRPRLVATARLRVNVEPLGRYSA
jgi:hypothetical protein